MNFTLERTNKFGFQRDFEPNQISNTPATSWSKFTYYPVATNLLHYTQITAGQT